MIGVIFEQCDENGVCVMTARKKLKISRREANRQGYSYDEYREMNKGVREKVVDRAWWERMRAEILEEAHGRCQGKDHYEHCPREFWNNILVLRSGGGDKKHMAILDHIVPTAPEFGGKMWDKDNLQILCYYCHQVKTSYEIGLWREMAGVSKEDAADNMRKVRLEGMHKWRKDKVYGRVAEERNKYDALLDSMGR